MNIKKQLHALGLAPRPHWSQNFLHDERVVERMVRAAQLSKQDIVLEIGTGLGILTQALSQAVARVISFDVDGKLLEKVSSHFADLSNVEWVSMDFLKYDLKSLKERFPVIKVVSNLPYHISTEVLFRFLEERSGVSSMTFMLQKEVGRRIAAVANTKAYGVLSIFSQVYADIEICFDIAPGCFYPRPRVCSSVLHFKVKPTLPFASAAEEKRFKKIVKTAFGHRRKILRHALLELSFTEPMLNHLIHKGYDLCRRPESFSVVEWMRLNREIQSVEK
ncbi:MAG: ribosomal RNA small subunit methyltransferase A [Deltaproteobacteria bacterium]|nr:ribosomal RNA small subunit methyltransferase A [Deltaproteobacteria bacterium]